VDLHTLSGCPGAALPAGSLRRERLRPIRGSSWCGARIDRASGMRGRAGS
jgi:hypothetical protein